MPEYVRVRQRATGYNMTIPARRYNPKLHSRVDDEPALDRHGDPAEPNYHPVRAKKQRARTQTTRPSNEASRSGSKKDGQQAETPKEEN